MKFFLLLISLAATLCKPYEVHFFRFKDGAFRKENAGVVAITGTMYHTQVDDIREIMLMAMDYSTMTPVHVYGVVQGPNSRGAVKCRMGSWNFGRQQEMSGFIRVNKFGNSTELSAVCVTRTRERWVFVTSNVETPAWFYAPKEAGARAKLLLNQSSERYRSHHVILFAMADLPDSNSCSTFLGEQYPTIDGPEIGAIMVGKDGEHCGIVDDEGTKFVHSNPVAKKVALEHLSAAGKYFPNGIIYKRYPKFPKPELPY